MISMLGSEVQQDGMRRYVLSAGDVPAHEPALADCLCSPVISLIILLEWDISSRSMA